MKTFTVLVLAATLATAAHAQPNGRLKLGVAVGFHEYSNGNFSVQSVSISPHYGIGFSSNTHRQGLSFGLRGGIGIAHPDRSDDVAGSRIQTGSLRSVAVMGGAGSTYRTGPLSIGLAVVAGPSFNKFSLDEAMRVAYRDHYGATLNSIEVKHSVAVRPNVSIWYNLTDRLGLQSSVGYTANRPTVETTINGVTTRGRWNADRWSYQTGFAFGIF
jgi:hypothetical protein